MNCRHIHDLQGSIRNPSRADGDAVAGTRHAVERDRWPQSCRFEVQGERAGEWTSELIVYSRADGNGVRRRRFELSGYSVIDVSIPVGTDEVRVEGAHRR